MSQIITALQEQKTLNQLAMALPRHLSAERFARVAITEVRKNPELAKCSTASFMSCLIQSAQLGLEIGSALGYAYLIPFRNNKTGEMDAQFIVGYKGLLALARRSGEIKRVSANCVYEGDEFDYALGTEEFIKHKPHGETNYVKITYAYAIAEFKDGGTQQVIMTRSEIDRIKDRGRRNPVWNTDYAEMAKKTVLRRLAKMLPLSPDLADAISVEDEANEVMALPPSKTPHKIMHHQLVAAEEENRSRADAANKAEWNLAWDAFNKEWMRLEKAGKNPAVIVGNKSFDELSHETASGLDVYTEMLAQA